MRVITGTAKGKRLEMLKEETVRPTTDKVKEAIFSVIQFEIPGRTFLDLFAGCGQMGIEALSRGAKKAVFVDRKNAAIDVIKRNLKSSNLFEKAEVINTDSIMYLKKCNYKYDIAFLDPPYRTGLLQEALSLVTKNINSGGIILCEHPIDEVLPKSVNKFCITKEYKYGKISFTLYREGSDI